MISANAPVSRKASEADHGGRYQVRSFGFADGAQQDLPADGAQNVIGVDQCDSGDQIKFIGIVGRGPEAVPVKLSPRSYLQVHQCGQDDQHEGRDQKSFLIHEFALEFKRVVQKKRPAFQDA